MAYQIKKTERITEDLELLAPDDSVALHISVDVSPETIAKDYRRVQLELAKAHKAGDMAAFEQASSALFRLVLGEEAVTKLVDYFGGSYVDMSIQVLPFIYDRIQPAVERYVRSRKELLANNANLNRRQRRKMGL